MLDIYSRDVDGVQVVDIEGKMTTTAAPDAGDFLTELLDNGATRILLNLENVDFIASTGLRVILATGKRLAKSNGKLVICGLNPTVKEVFRMSGFTTMFGVFETEEDALAAI